MDLFQQVTLSDTEQDVVVAAFSQPAVKKFLTSFANDAIKDLAYGEPAVNETPESYLRRQALVKGRLEAVATLLQIKSS